MGNVAGEIGLAVLTSKGIDKAAKTLKSSKFLKCTAKGWFGKGKRGNRDLDIFQKLLNGSKEGSRKDLLINQIEDGTTVIFRKDFGSLSHGKPNHYNIEIQVPFRNGMKTIKNLHIEADDREGIIQITR